MLSELKTGAKVIGIKQTQRALKDGKLRLVFLAEDADSRVTEPLEALCRELGVEVKRVPHKKELGSVCGIAVSSAVVGLFRDGSIEN